MSVRQTIIVYHLNFLLFRRMDRYYFYCSIVKYEISAFVFFFSLHLLFFLFFHYIFGWHSTASFHTSIYLITVIVYLSYMYLFSLVHMISTNGFSRGIKIDDRVIRFLFHRFCFFVIVISTSIRFRNEEKKGLTCKTNKYIMLKFVEISSVVLFFRSFSIFISMHPISCEICESKFENLYLKDFIFFFKKYQYFSTLN